MSFEINEAYFKDFDENEGLIIAHFQELNNKLNYECKSNAQVGDVIYKEEIEGKIKLLKNIKEALCCI